MGTYIPHTPEEERSMLEALGLSDLDQLFSDLPAQVRLNRAIDLPPGRSELEVRSRLAELAAKNAPAGQMPIFLGAGAYDHYIPSTVNPILSRSEFYTAYTPYQPEISQGTLQAIFEYQSMICALTGMAVSNASLYDGGSAAAEGAFMALDATGRRKVAVSGAVNPEYRRILATYMDFFGAELVTLPCADGQTDPEALAAAADDKTAAVIVQNPNFFGIVEDIQALAPLIHGQKALMIVAADPISLGLLTAPGDLGADIVVGEGQSLGNPMSLGGPYLGFIASTQRLIRRMPGRIVGETADIEGRRGFVSTLQTREQHIRREKATSNICSNQALNALAACVMLATVGREGIREMAQLCWHKAHYAQKALLKRGRFQPLFNKPFFKEFAVVSDQAPERQEAALLQAGILGGYPLARSYPEYPQGVLYCVTEKRTKAEIDRLVQVLEGDA